MTKIPEQITVPAVQSDYIFGYVKDSEGKLKIQIYCPDHNKWKDCGQMLGDFQEQDLKVFLFSEERVF